jgi:phage terminase small subunit
MKRKDDLTPREIQFCLDYLRDKNGTRAYMAAFKTKNANTAGVQSFRLLRKPKIAAFIDKELKRIEEDLGFSARDVLRKLWSITDFDLNKIRNDDGSFKPHTEWPEGYGKLLLGVEVDELFDGDGRDKEKVGETKKIKVEARTPALVALGRYFKLFTDKIEHSGTVSLADKMAAARKRVEARQK